MTVHVRVRKTRIGDRLFRSLFRDSTTHVAGLLRVRTETLFDGRSLLYELQVFTRTRSDVEWSEPRETREIGTIDPKLVTYGVRTTAIRMAVAFHDACVEKAFASEDAACSEVDS